MVGLKPLLIFNKPGNLLVFSNNPEIRSQRLPSGHTGINPSELLAYPSHSLQASKEKHIKSENQLMTFLQYATLPITGFAHVFMIIFFYSLRTNSVFTCSLRAAQRQGQQQKGNSLSLPQELTTRTNGTGTPETFTLKHVSVHSFLKETAVG